MFCTKYEDARVIVLRIEQKQKNRTYLVVPGDVGHSVCLVYGFADKST